MSLFSKKVEYPFNTKHVCWLCWFSPQKLSVIDDIAPVKVRKKSGRQKAPWRNSTAV